MSVSDRYAGRRQRAARTFAERNARAAADRARAAGELAALRMSLDPTGLPACDLCGALIAPARAGLHRSRCQ